MIFLSCNSCVMSDNLICYCYGSRGMEEPTEIPYYTPERTGDPPGTSFYTLQIPPTQRMRGERTRVIILLMMMNMRTNQECLLILKLFGCLQYQLVNNILSTNHLLLLFIIFLLKELANLIITIVNPFCSPFLKGVLECKNNLIFRS